MSKDLTDKEREELRRLIKEQERDMKQGLLQRPEPGTVHFKEPWHLEQLIDDEGHSYMDFGGSRAEKTRGACVIHGLTRIRSAPPSVRRRGQMWVCAACQAENQRRYRETHRTRFNEMRRAREKRYREAHREARNAYKRAWYEKNAPGERERAAAYSRRWREEGPGA